jgi:hypothetical protein
LNPSRKLSTETGQAQWKARIELTGDELKGLRLELLLGRADGIWELDQVLMNGKQMFVDGLPLSYERMWDYLDQLGTSAANCRDRRARRELPVTRK